MTYTIQFGLRIDEETSDRIEKLAKIMRRDKSEVIRILICDADLEAYKHASAVVRPKNGLKHSH